MNLQYSPAVIPLIIVALLSLALAWTTWRHRPAPGVMPFFILMLAVAGWSLGYALELGSADLQAKLLWAKIQYLGIATVPSAWLVFVIQYLGKEKWLTRRNLALLLIMPLVTLQLVWTNDLHHLFYASTRLDTSGSFSMLDVTYGPGFWASAAYGYLLLLFGTLLLIGALLRSRRLYRGQTVALLIGACAPWIGNALYLSGLSPFPQLDSTPFAFAVTGLTMAWALVHFRLLDIVPVARDRVIEDMRDAVLVLDTQSRIVDINPAALKLLGLAAQEALGRPAPQVLAAHRAFIEPYYSAAEAHTEITVGDGAARRCFELRISPLRSRQGDLTGRVVILHDITERKRAGQQQMGLAVERERANVLERSIAEREQVEEALHRRDVILEALAHTGEQLLVLSDLEQVLPDVLAYLGRAAGVSRAYLFENQTADDGSLLAGQRGEWVAPGHSPQGDGSGWHDFSYQASGLGRWAESLSEGHPLYGAARDFPAKERAIFASRGVLSFVAVPVFVGGGWWGFLGFEDCEQPREWFVAEIEAFKNFADTLGAAITRQQAEAAEREQRALAEALRDTAAALTGTLDSKAVLSRILENVGRVVPHDAANIMLIEGKVAYVAYWRGYWEVPQTFTDATRFSLEMPTLREMLTTGTPILIPDTASYAGWTHRTEADWVRSYTAVPLQTHGRVIGFLNLNSAQPDFFTPAHTERLRAFANQAAVAIENARLYDESLRHVSQLEEHVAQRTMELQRAKERLESILNSSDDAILLTRADGTIRQANLAFDRMFGYDVDETFGQPVAVLARPDYSPTLMDALDAALTHLQPQRIELVARRGDSTTFDADMVLSPIVGTMSDELGLVCSLRDITERKQEEAQLRRALEKERELGELKSRFVSMVSHEFRTPLATIQVTSESLSNYFNRMNEEQRIRRFGKIQTQVQHMTALLEDVLAIGRMDAGRAEFNPESLDLAALCREIVEEVSQTTDTHQIVCAAPDGRIEVMADGKLMRQIVANLLSNGVKYSPEGSTVRLALSRENGQTVLRVQDEGIGIPEEDQERLFEVFHRAKNVGTVAGTGLGLAVAKRAVDLHGGTITFESKVGVGTVFTVVLPIGEQGEQAR